MDRAPVRPRLSLQNEEWPTMLGSEFFRQMAAREPFSRLHPKLAAFFRDYLADEKVVRFGERYVLNTHFPPFPSPAFDRLVEQFRAIGESGDDCRLFSVTWAVTNRCHFRCWHCYNAGRSPQDLPLDTMRDVAAQLQELGVVVLTLTGGEPLLREDLEEIAGFFSERTCLVLGTTGDGLTAKRARALAASGVFAMGVSLDSTDAAEHDTMRGREGAFRIALDALRTAKDAGLYPYVVSVATREFLERARFMDFLEFARGAGALEVHLLEPSASGRLAGREDVLLRGPERALLLQYQKEVSAREDLPILSSFTYLESAKAFGCGAGLTHLYVDGSGEVCPCNLVPLSFGNVHQESLKEILRRMGEHFRRPRCACVGRQLAGKLHGATLPAPPDVSCEVCRRHLSQDHEVPRFFQVRSQAGGRVGAPELRLSYDRVHAEYDEFWLVQAGRPVDELVARLHLRGGERVFEAGCGTGYATRQLADGVGARGRVLAVDLSEGMLEEARRRMGDAPGVCFQAGDALEALRREGRFDLVFSSWVLGYIPLRPFFEAATSALAAGGRLAFVVHKQNSPSRELGLFARIVADDPSVLLKQVEFDFPRDVQHVRSELERAGLRPEDLCDGTVAFEYPNPEGVLEHLLKSGAGTAFYDAVDPAKRSSLQRRFLECLGELSGGGPCRVVHDYVACIAQRLQPAGS